VQKCANLEEPRKRLNENQQQEKENEVHEKAVSEKLHDVPIKDLKSVFLGVKSQIRRGISKPRYIFPLYI
jgi:hypothetical protein